MNKSLICVCAFFLGLAANLILAQESTAPPDPQVAPVPESVHWELVATLKQKPATDEAPATENPNNLQRVEVTRTGRIQRVMVEYGGGVKQTVWVAGGEMFVDINNLVSSGATTGMIPQFYTISDRYYGTDWITASHFQKRMPWEKGEVDFYETDEPSETEKMAAQMAGSSIGDLRTIRRAWIDVTTRLPVAISAPEGTLYYQFLPPPEAPLQLPAQFSEKQKQREAEVRRQQQEAATR